MKKKTFLFIKNLRFLNKPGVYFFIFFAMVFFQCRSSGLRKEIFLKIPKDLQKNLSWKKNYARYYKNGFVEVELSILKDSEFFNIIDFYYQGKKNYRNLPLLVFKLYIKNLTEENIEFLRWKQFIHLFLINSPSNFSLIKTESSWCYYFFQDQFFSSNYQRFQFGKLFNFFPGVHKFSNKLFKEQALKEKVLVFKEKVEIEKDLKKINFRKRKKISKFPATRYDKYVLFPGKSVLTLIAWAIPGPEIKQFIVEINLSKNFKAQKGILFPFGQRIVRKNSP